MTLRRNPSHANLPQETTRSRDDESRGEPRPTVPKDVMAADYDRPDRECRPRGVSKVAIEPMDPGGVALLAHDLLELLDWARSDEESKNG